MVSSVLFQIGAVRLRVFAARRSPKSSPNIPQRDSMGKEHHIRRTTRLPTLMVVVSCYPLTTSGENMYIGMEGTNVSCSQFFFPLHSVFWDLYCAAPERRETCDHSSEAKAFHDYGFVNSGYSVNGIPHVSQRRYVCNGSILFLFIISIVVVIASTT